MASTITRRPLPALVSLLALLILTAIVWWRVVNRDSDGAHAAKPAPVTCTTAPTAATTTGGTRSAAPPAGTEPADVTVVVLNSTDRGGIAASARTALLARGFRIPQPAGNDTTHPQIAQTAELRFGTAGRAGAQLLQYYLPGSVLVPSSASGATVTVSLGTGYRSVATAAQVKAARAAAGTPTSTPTSSGSATAAATPRC